MTVPPYTLYTPARNAIPLLLDSPHSGTYYPTDFAAALPVAALRTAEDTHVDALFSGAMELGATLLCATYPRAYIDCNRRIDDIDSELLAEVWHEAIHASDKTALGYGLVWRKLDDGSDIYDRKLRAAEVKSRIEQVYTPYWKTLEREATGLRDRFGALYHMNCHSMPARATHASHLPLGTPHADIVLGDRDGTTCSAPVMDALARAFRTEGFTVKLNDPYKGVEIVRRIGNPKRNRHSVQVEINRALYMDEMSRARTASFDRVKSGIENALRSFVSFIEETPQTLQSCNRQCA